MEELRRGCLVGSSNGEVTGGIITKKLKEALNADDGRGDSSSRADFGETEGFLKALDTSVVRDRGG